MAALSRLAAPGRRRAPALRPRATRPLAPGPLSRRAPSRAWSIGPCRWGGTLVAHGGSLAETSAAVLFGHGLGDGPDGWYEQCMDWAQELPWVRFVLPPAPVRPVTLNGGLPMPAWYDVRGLGDRLQEPAEGAEASRERWADLMEAQASEIGGRDRVVIAGFSQGGAMALHTALRVDMLPMPAGVLCMSGYLPNAAAVEQDWPPGARPLALQDLPVLLCHGRQDPMVEVTAARRTRDALEAMGLRNVELREYDGLGHGVTEAELHDVTEWLRQILPQRHG